MPKHIDKLISLCAATLCVDESKCLVWPYSRNNGGYAEYSGTLVHIAICTAVHGAKPHPRMLVAHGCGNGHLGCINPRHLRWAFPRQNSADAVAHGRMPRGTKSHKATLTEDLVRQIRDASSERGLMPIAEKFGISLNQVSRIRRRRTWKHVA